MLERVKELSSLKNYIELKKYLTSLDPADIAIFISELSAEEFVIVYRLLPKDIAAEVFVELDSDLEEKLINLFTDKELKEVLDELSEKKKALIGNNIRSFVRGSLADHHRTAPGAAICPPACGRRQLRI